MKNVSESSVSAFNCSLNVTLMTMPVDTPVAPGAGVIEVTSGGVVSSFSSEESPPQAVKINKKGTKKNKKYAVFFISV